MAEHANVYPLRREPQREREPQPEPRPQERQIQEPLWREVLGRRLRVLRQEQQETLSETAARAGISPQYLSEVERGRKEPSSEMIAALAGALSTTLIDLNEQVATDLRRQQALAPRAGRTGPVMLSLAAEGPSPPKAQAGRRSLSARASSRRCPST
jgi:transcriptional regulator with XRE-family HTH domain